jgi:uncharacterized membrane protein
VTQTTVTTGVHKTFDVGRNFAAEVALYLVVLLNNFTDLVNFFRSYVVNVACPVNTYGVEDLESSITTNAENVGKSDICTLTSWEIYTCNSSHNLLLVCLALTLFMSGIFANDSQDALAPDNLALRAHFLN